MYTCIPIYLLYNILASPNIDIEEFDDVLIEIEKVVRDNRNRKTVICEDLNAPTWSPDKENWRGYKLKELASILDLRLVNVGVIPTCVRYQDTSV